MNIISLKCIPPTKVSFLGPSAYDGTSRLPKEYQDILIRQMSTSTSADERESTASKDIAETEKDEEETADNENNEAKSNSEEDEEGNTEKTVDEEKGEQDAPEEETGEGKDAVEAANEEEAPRFEENDESTTHDSDAASEDTEGPEEGFDEDPANAKVSNLNQVTFFCRVLIV